jgi:hypothetical protein
MGIFEAQARKYTGEEDMLTSSVFGTLEIIDRSKFLAPILGQCGVELGEETDPGRFTFSYWETIGERTPDVVLKDKPILISIECKLNAPLDFRQLVDEYKDGVEAHKNFWLIAVTSDYVEPTEILQKAKDALIRDGYKEPRIQWLNWQQIHTFLRKNARIGNETEEKLIGNLLSLLKAKGLSVFIAFEKAQLSSVATLWPKVINFLEEYSAFLGTLSSRLHRKNITCIEKGYIREVVQTGYKAMGLQDSTHWLPRSIAMRAWDNDWKEKEDSQGFLIFFRFSPLELEVGYRLGFWKQNLKPMFIETAQSCALAEKLHPLNCSVSYYGQDYEMLKNRVAGDSLSEEAFSLEALRNVGFVIIGRAFNHAEMASLKLLDEVEECLVRIRDIINENDLYLTEEAITKHFASREAIEPVESQPSEQESAEE